MHKGIVDLRLYPVQSLTDSISGGDATTDFVHKGIVDLR